MKYFVSYLPLYNKAIKVLKVIMQESCIFAAVLIHRVEQLLSSAGFFINLGSSRSLGIFVYFN